MLVCLCRAVRDDAVRTAMEQGARTFGDVARRCGAGTVCGGCRPAIERMLDEHWEGSGMPRRRYGYADPAL